MTCAPAYGLGTSKKKKKKPYADYDLRPRPMAWAQVIIDRWRSVYSPKQLFEQ